MSTVISKKDYGELVSQHAQHVLGFVMRLLSDRSEAEDVAQDVFVKAYQRLDTFRGDSSFLTWVLRIAYHESVNHLRRQRPCMIELDEVAAHSDMMSCSTIDKEFTTGSDERIQLLEKAVEDLKPDDQLLIHMYYYEERSLNDIAYIMDAEPNTLSQRLRRIRKRLMVMIKQKEDGRD